MQRLSATAVDYGTDAVAVPWWRLSTELAHESPGVVRDVVKTLARAMRVIDVHTRIQLRREEASADLQTTVLDDRHGWSVNGCAKTIGRLPNRRLELESSRSKKRVCGRPRLQHTHVDYEMYGVAPTLLRRRVHSWGMMENRAMEIFVLLSIVE